MNQSAADDTDNLTYWIETDNFGNLYVVWTEISDSTGEGINFFCCLAIGVYRRLGKIISAAYKQIGAKNLYT